MPDGAAEPGATGTMLPNLPPRNLPIGSSYQASSSSSYDTIISKSPLAATPFA